MSQSVSNAVATRDSGPAGLVKQYSSDFSSLLPSHVKPDTWIRLAAGALKRGKQIQTDQGPRYELEVAAANNVGVFLAALKDAARLGLDPGTEQYYLTPRKEKGQLQILGIVGYQGLVELMYRAGAVSSVIVECVYTHDRFDYVLGKHDRPIHEINWDLEDRGQLRLAYAYAIMHGGAVSKVVVMNRAAIQRIKASSQGATSEHSPWVKHEPSMWMKSAARQLAKWVPTSSEYMRERLKVAAEVGQAESPAPVPAGPPMPGSTPDEADRSTGEIFDAEIVDPPADPWGDVNVAQPPLDGA
jgi:recombination protein RecT